VGKVVIELELGADTRKVMDDVKSRVDAINTFPEETEKPVIKEVTSRRQVIDVALWGDADETTLKFLAESVRDEIAALPGVSQVELANARPYEVSIEISEQDLRRHGLTFKQVADAVRRSSLDLPGGSVKTSGGEILLRAKGQAYRRREFEDLVLLSHPDGTHLRLGEVARVDDGFAETDQFSFFDGKPSLVIRVFRTGEQGALDIAGKVKNYVKEAQARMPEGITLTTWRDTSKELRDRLDLMVRSGRAGFVLVFLTLALFLRFRLAFWVSLGIPVSFLGAFWLMPTFDVSINMISAFAFIVVLGIVVDDAIVVGESIFTHQQRTGRGLEGAIKGTKEVTIPVVFAVLTSVAAFLPLLAVPGTMGKMMHTIPLIVIPCLLFSLVESMWILPAHLSHIGARNHADGKGRWRRFQGRFASGLEHFIEGVYKPFLELAIRWRYLTLAVGVAILIVTLGMVGGGWIRFVYFPEVEANFITATLTMPQGAPVAMTARGVSLLEESARDLRGQLEAETGTDLFRHSYTAVGDQPYRTAQATVGPGAARQVNFSGSHLGEVTIELIPAEERDVGSAELAERWREMTDHIPDALEMSFSAELFSPGEDINVELTGPDLAELRKAAAELKLSLSGYAGVYEISDSFREGKKEVKLKIKPAAEVLGLTLADLARQVRQAFYGEEAQRIQRGRDDIRVMVRYPKEERRSLGDLENMRIRTPNGQEVPFDQVALVEPGRGFASIQRVDRRRAVNVTADVDAVLVTPGDIIADLEARVLPEIVAEHPSVFYTLEGAQAEQRESLGGLQRGFAIALLLIYALLAIPLRSYSQPLIIMAAIPFGVVGAAWGHFVMGINLTIISLFGIVALAGVVVNDSLVMVDFINRNRRRGEDLAVAVRQAGVVRFRPILLTSLTTFAGLLPLLLERSMQARFLIPMAVSLAFGVLFATFITLLLVPAGYTVLEDIKAGLATVSSRLRGRDGAAVGEELGAGLFQGHPDE
jgi:multidrug efflux pump subunit AcrB